MADDEAPLVLHEGEVETEVYAFLHLQVVLAEVDAAFVSDLAHSREGLVPQCLGGLLGATKAKFFDQVVAADAGDFGGVGGVQAKVKRKGKVFTLSTVRRFFLPASPIVS